MMEQGQRGLVRPLQILEDEEQGDGPSRALQHGGHALEEISTRLLQGQLRRRWELREDAAQAGRELRQLGGSLAQALPEQLSAGCACAFRFNHFRKREVGARLLPLVTVADQGAK